MEKNVPVLVGPVPLFYVQSLSITEGYDIQRIMGSPFLQATRPTRKQIAIEALLVGPRRLGEKKALEALALVSPALLATSVTVLSAGIPVVCGLTISLGMQITDLRFTQSVARRDALEVTMTLLEVPRSSLAALIGEVTDLAVAAGTALLPGTVTPNPIARAVTGPFIR